MYPSTNDCSETTLALYILSAFRGTIWLAVIDSSCVQLIMIPTVGVGTMPMSITRPHLQATGDHCLISSLQDAHPAPAPHRPRQYCAHAMPRWPHGESLTMSLRTRIVIRGNLSSVLPFLKPVESHYNVGTGLSQSILNSLNRKDAFV